MQVVSLDFVSIIFTHCLLLWTSACEKLSHHLAAGFLKYLNIILLSKIWWCVFLAEYDEENPKIITKCDHHFHLACILEWMERSDTCPICDQVLLFHILSKSRCVLLASYAFSLMLRLEYNKGYFVMAIIFVSISFLFLLCGLNQISFCEHEKLTAFDCLAI